MFPYPQMSPDGTDEIALFAGEQVIGRGMGQVKVRRGPDRRPSAAAAPCALQFGLLRED